MSFAGMTPHLFLFLHHLAEVRMYSFPSKLPRKKGRWKKKKEGSKKLDWMTKNIIILLIFLSTKCVKTSTLSVVTWYFINQSSQWGWAGNIEEKGTCIWKILPVSDPNPLPRDFDWHSWQNSIPKVMEVGKCGVLGKPQVARFTWLCFHFYSWTLSYVH